MPVSEIKLPSELGRKSKFGNSRLHKDHVIARSHGGEGGETRYVCWFCNLARKDNDPKHDHAIAAAGRAFWSAINRK